MSEWSVISYFPCSGGQTMRTLVFARRYKQCEHSLLLKRYKRCERSYLNDINAANRRYERYKPTMQTLIERSCVSVVKNYQCNARNSALSLTILKAVFYNLSAPSFSRVLKDIFGKRKINGKLLKRVLLVFIGIWRSEVFLLSILLK